MVYFIQAVDGGPIKIGYSKDVEARRRMLESAYKRPLAVLATMPGGRKEEAEVHDRFSHLRFGRTEQFRPNAELLEFIGRPLLVSANAKSVEVMPSKDLVAFQVRASEEYKAVLVRLAKFDGKSIASLADHAIRLYLRSIGFPEVLPKR